MADDRLEDRLAPKFDPARVDRRPLGEWQLNASAAVVRLDVPPVKPALEDDFLILRPSYSAASAAARKHHSEEVILPSVNMIDGKAKQFDDGLYAALDQAYYQGLAGTLQSHVQLVRNIYDKAGSDNPAAPYLAAGLDLAGISVPVADRREKDKLLRDFLASEIASKPIGFYTWNPSLESCFRFVRFFQKEFKPEELMVPLALARVLAQNPPLLADYRKANRFYAQLTNPFICLSLDDLPNNPSLGTVSLEVLRLKKGVFHRKVAFFPPSSSRETILFEKLFPADLPASADLMHELIQRIRSGKVDLKPNANSGWYDHQVYALETLLLPEKGEERDKLLLTKTYKKRMQEAFKALITKRHETHVRQLSIGVGCLAMAPQSLVEQKITPRLRVEPCPSYFVRTARAYAFLADFLEAAVGRESLQSLHGLRKEGPRDQDLYTELNFMRDLFYGLYLVSAEDLGMKPAFAAGEPVDQERCYAIATDWLAKAFEDRDLGVDTRVNIPIFVDPNRGVIRLWATLGVRLARLDAGFARPPHVRLHAGTDWQPVEISRLGTASYLIPVDEFIEVEVHGPRTLTREEFRALCDREKTKDAILAALRGM